MRYLLTIFILIFVLMKVGNAQSLQSSGLIRKGETLILVGEENSEKCIEIYTLNGQLLRNFSTVKGYIKVDNLCLASGVYQVQVRSGRVVTSGQIVLP